MEYDLERRLEAVVEKWRLEHFVPNTSDTYLLLGDNRESIHSHQFDRPALYIFGLWVSPPDRGRGVAGLLLKEVCELADRERLPVMVEPQPFIFASYFLTLWSPVAWMLQCVRSIGRLWNWYPCPGWGMTMLELKKWYWRRGFRPVGMGRFWLREPKT